jgi:hypothetical protein
MPLEPTFPTVAGIKTKSIGNIISSRLESTYDRTKTTMDIDPKHFYWDSSNQDLPASITGTKNIIVRVHSGRTQHTDLEIGVNTIRYIARPSIHVFAKDPQATIDRKVSDLAEDVAQYIRAFIADNVSGFQNEGIHSVVGLFDEWVPNNGDINWHHWKLELSVEYEMRRTV